MAVKQFYQNSENFFLALLDAIGQAQSSIILEYYIFDFSSDIGEKIVQALTVAEGRGVKVHLRLDGVGSREWLLTSQFPLQLPGVEISIYNPVPWPLARFMNSEKSYLQQFFEFWSHVNHRNHKKLCIIDGQMAFVGSMNIHTETFAWEEFGLSCDGPMVKSLFESYLQIIDKCSPLFVGEKSELFSTKVKRRVSFEKNHVLAQNNRFQRVVFRRQHRDHFKNAKSEILMITPYFVPRLRLIKALVAAKKRGVRVRLLLSQRLDHLFMNWLIDKYLYPLIQSGVEVYKSEKMVHAKLVKIDDWLHLGSCNLNQRSLHLDLELNVIVENSSIQTKMTTTIEEKIDQAQKVTLPMLQQRPWFEKVMGTFVFLFRRML